MNDLDAVSKARKDDVQHIMRLVSIYDRTVLEIGCGTGRITFPLAEIARKITAIDIDIKAIEDARKRNRFENVTFLVGNIETTQLGQKFDVILSTWMGYVYLNDIPKVISNISSHLKDDGVFLLCSGSPIDEYNHIVDLLVEDNIKSISFYEKLENQLSTHFEFEKHILDGELAFSKFDEVIDRFRTELKTEHEVVMEPHHEHQLEDHFAPKDSLVIGWDSLAYLCRKR